MDAGYARFTFQSLNWDGVISNGVCDDCGNRRGRVSIPQLGWGDFKLDEENIIVHEKRVSIPQLGWGDFKLKSQLVFVDKRCVSIPQLGWGDFKLPCPRCGATVQIMFQSLNWDGVISNLACPARRNRQSEFQSLNWDGVISNIPRTHTSPPHSGFQSLNWDGVISNWQGGALLNRNGRGFNPSIGMG